MFCSDFKGETVVLERPEKPEPSKKLGPPLNEMWWHLATNLVETTELKWRLAVLRLAFIALAAYDLASLIWRLR